MSIRSLGVGIVSVLSLVSLSGLSCSAHAVRKPAEENPWSKVTKPSSGKQRAVGFYSDGCLGGASALPLNGHGFQTMRPSRHRYYGTTELLDFIQRFTNETVDQKVGVLLIGDMSQPRGGPMPPPAHASHQIGLDVDIWYWIQPDAQYRPLTTEERENLSAISLVDLNKLELKKDLWKPEHARMLQIASEQPDTERIFVNPAIKRELCETIPASQHGWLHKIRPWFEHHDHFHVRLKCPASEPGCVKQDPIPAGDGCGSDLDWWFTPEAHQVSVQANEQARAVPKLPNLCTSILNDAGVSIESPTTSESF